MAAEEPGHTRGPANLQEPSPEARHRDVVAHDGLGLEANLGSPLDCPPRKVGVLTEGPAEALVETPDALECLLAVGDVARLVVTPLLRGLDRPAEGPGTRRVGRVGQRAALDQVGVFDHPPTAEPDAYAADVATPDHVLLSRRIAEDGSVLLKNDGGVLPSKAVATMRSRPKGRLICPRQTVALRRRASTVWSKRPALPMARIRSELTEGVPEPERRTSTRQV